MAKKRTKKKVAAKKSVGAVERVPRKEYYSAARLTAHVERIREQAARLAGLARAMEDADVERILVDGHAMLLRGMNQIDNFADNASRAVREAKTAMLDQ